MIIKKLKLLHVAGSAFIPSLPTGCFSNEPLTKTCEKAEQSEHCIAELFRKMFIKKEIANLDVTHWYASKSTGFPEMFRGKKSVCHEFIEMQKEKIK